MKEKRIPDIELVPSEPEESIIALKKQSSIKTVSTRTELTHWKRP